MKNKNLDKPHKIRTTVEELEVLARLKDTIEWEIAKRWMRRYIANLKNISFNLSYGNTEENFKVKHRDLTAEARALKNFVKVVEKAGKRLDEMEERKKK